MAGDEEKQAKIMEAIAKAVVAAGGGIEDINDGMRNVSKEMSKQIEFWERQQTLSENQLSNLEQVRDLARENGQLADNTLAQAQARIRADRLIYLLIMRGCLETAICKVGGR